jgi:hypothetical protein
MTRLCLLFSAVLGTAGGAWGAERYSMQFAIDAGEIQQVGRVESCSYGHSCRATIPGLDIDMGVVLRSSSDRAAAIHLSQNGGCCYFAEGETWTRVDARRRVHHLKVFEGKGRKKNEFVINRLVGTLSLVFSH